MNSPKPIIYPCLKYFAVFYLISVVLLSGCRSSSHHDIPPVSPQRGQELDQKFSNLLAKHNLITAGVAVIKGGKVVWEGYYGDEKPGKPATEEKQFDVASITKNVSAETVLRLVDEGKLSLEESMSKYWVDPDIADDPRHKLVTSRMALTHATGFRNWRFFLMTTHSFRKHCSSSVLPGLSV